MAIRVTQLRPDTPVGHPEINRLDYRIDLGDRYYDVFIQGREITHDMGLEPALPLALLAGMRLGRPIHVAGPLTRTYLNGVQRVVAYYATHFEQLKVVEITCDELFEGLPAESNRVASFFSGGVDSFFTLMKFKQQLTDIIYIYGFDVRLDDWPRRDVISAMGKAVAAEFGLNFIEIESNFGKVIQDFGSWAELGHGMALASTARALAGTISKAIIPGTFSISNQMPFGSGLETDPLYSDECILITHDACDAKRIDKVERLSHEPLALKYLRVCWENVEGAYNCCRCEKCMRTMCSLDALGVLDRSESFPLALTPKLVADVLLNSPYKRIATASNIELYQRMGKGDSPMVRALQQQLKRPIWLASWYAKWRKRRLRWKRLLLKLSKRFQPSSA